VTDPAATGQPPAHFHRNPPGRGQLAIFLALLAPFVSTQMCSSLAPWKQPTDPAAAGRNPC